MVQLPNDRPYNRDLRLREWFGNAALMYFDHLRSIQNNFPVHRNIFTVMKQADPMIMHQPCLSYAMLGREMLIFANPAPMSVQNLNKARKSCIRWWSSNDEEQIRYRYAD